MTAKAQSSHPDGYVHARDLSEYQRLRDQALMWQRATEELLDQIGLKPGMACLDVGSGPGAVMRLMADRVGPEGRVIGIEIDGALGDQALAELRAQGGAAFEHIAGRCRRPRRGPGRAVRPHLLPAVSHAYAGAGGGAGEDALLDQAGRHRGGSRVRLRRHRGRAALPGNGRVQPPVRERVQGPWPKLAGRAPTAGAVRGGRHRHARRHAWRKRNSCRSKTWRKC